MSTEWTAKRLDALPDHTVILSGSGQEPLRRDRELAGEDGWIDTEGLNVFSDEIATIGSIRVVSVPVDALLNEGVAATANPPVADGHIRAAIAHITGEAP